MKVTGPLFSFDGSGSIGNAITAASWRGRQYVKKLGIPTTAYSPNQRTARAKLGFLKAAWRHMNALTGVDCQAQWIPLTDPKTSSPYHTFISYNMARWTATQGPVVYPGGGAHTAIGANGFQRGKGTDWLGCLLTFTNNIALWGAQFHLMEVPTVPPTMDTLMWCVHYWPRTMTSQYFVVKEIPPGTYFGRIVPLCTDGSHATLTNGPGGTFP